jgi:hypothetical protein
MADPDYTQIPIPEDKPRSEYTYAERRAAILRLIETRGHPWSLNKSQLGREFDVSDVQIHKDLDRLREFYSNRIGTDSEFSSELAYKRIIKAHLDNDEYDKARRALDSWNGWLQDTGQQTKAPDRHEIEASGIIIDLGDDGTTDDD